LPKINTEYNAFDDGKVSISRRYKVIVKEIRPFEKIDKENLACWEKEVEQCYWLYNKINDFFIKTTDEEGVDEVFVRTVDNGWFSIGGSLNCGRLDVDGRLNDRLNCN